MLNVKVPCFYCRFVWNVLVRRRSGFMLMCLFQTRNKHAATTLPPFCAIIWLLCCTLAQQHLALTKEHNDSNSSVMRRRISLMIQTFPIQKAIEQHWWKASLKTSPSVQTWLMNGWTVSGVKTATAADSRFSFLPHFISSWTRFKWDPCVDLLFPAAFCFDTRRLETINPQTHVFWEKSG